MPELNADIPIIRCSVRGEFVGTPELVECDLIGIRSEPGQPLQFHALLRAGALYSGLPIHAFLLDSEIVSDTANVYFDDQPTQQQMWDCPSYWFSVHRFARLCEQVCTVRRLDGREMRGVYRFTVDWRVAVNEIDTSVVEIPDERKMAHVILGDDGLIYAMPNNRIVWEEPGFISRDDNVLQSLKPIKRSWRCERQFTTSEEDRFLYEAAPTQPAAPPSPMKVGVEWLTNEIITIHGQPSGTLVDVQINNEIARQKMTAAGIAFSGDGGIGCLLPDYKMQGVYFDQLTSDIVEDLSKASRLWVVNDTHLVAIDTPDYSTIYVITAADTPF